MGRPIRVLHTLSAIASGGVEMRHYQIATRLGAPRFDHRFIGTTGGTMTEKLLAEAIPVRLLGAVDTVFSPERYRQGVRLAKAWTPDLVHGAVMEGTSLGVVIAQRLRVPMILEETSDPSNRQAMGHRLVRLIAAGSTRCVAVSPAVGRYLTDNLGIPSRKVRVITNGVPAPAEFTPTEQAELRRRWGIGANDLVVGTVSRLFDDHKRVTDLIAAFRLLAANRPGLHLVVVGSGPDQEAMELAAVHTGYGDRIHFVGRHVPADAYYAIMDVFAIASSREAFGLVAAEAMRAGLPVVATAVGGLAEIVDEGNTGFLAPPLQPDTLARALEPLVDDDLLRERMGHAAAARADEHYSVERYLREVEELYLDLLDERSGRRS